MFRFANFVCLGNIFSTLRIASDNQPNSPPFNSSVYTQKKLFSVDSNYISIKPPITLKMLQLFIFIFSLSVCSSNDKRTIFRLANLVC